MVVRSVPGHIPRARLRPSVLAECRSPVGSTDSARATWVCCAAYSVVGSDPEDAVPLTESWALDFAVQQRQLSSKRDILGDEPCADWDQSKNAPDEIRHSRSASRLQGKSRILPAVRETVRTDARVVQNQSGPTLRKAQPERPRTTLPSRQTSFSLPHISCPVPPAASSRRSANIVESDATREAEQTSPFSINSIGKTHQGRSISRLLAI
jgi:hypothetical protein